jgi:hypothetical protein
MADMPSTGSLEREDRVIQQLVKHLQSSGATVTVVARPDRDVEHELTVDVVLRIDDEEWAVDVCALAHSPNKPMAVRRADEVLHKALEPIAEAHQVAIHVTCVAQEGEPGTPWGSDYYAAIVAEALRLAPNGPADMMVIDDGTYVHIVDAGQEPSSAWSGDVQVSTWLNSSPDIAEQVTNSLGTPIGSKLRGQLSVAREAGYRTALLLDAVAPADTGNWRHFDAGPLSVAAALDSLDVGNRGLDAAWLCDGQGHIHQVLPS